MHALIIYALPLAWTLYKLRFDYPLLVPHLQYIDAINGYGSINLITVGGTVSPEKRNSCFRLWNHLHCKGNSLSYNETGTSTPVSTDITILPSLKIHLFFSLVQTSSSQRCTTGHSSSTNWTGLANTVENEKTLRSGSRLPNLLTSKSFIASRQHSVELHHHDRKHG